ncbi:MAG: hypothetical protein K2K55_10970 [Duncaniella sp.]|nr:hypothetical protein [Duncaniella sp.]
MDKKDLKDTNLRGVDIDDADNEKVNAELVKEETESLNNNPRNEADIDD